jgi:DNA uptake protein ComE-like DNA-binding protein
VDTEEPKMVDINNDSEQAIAGLPGVGIILAKRAIELRESEPFKSVDDFGEILGLKPHIMEQIRPLIMINVSEELNEPETLGRVVDF